jgi:hypothetical protein
MTEEVWRDIPGYEGTYQVSNMGRVKSLPRQAPLMCNDGRIITRTLKGRILTPCVNKRGYESLVLRHDGKNRTYEVQRLVALAFLGPRPEGHETRHLDGNRLNNRLDNLAYGTRSQNQLDVYDYRGYHHRLTPANVLDIRARLAVGETGRALAREYKVRDSMISAIKHREVYKWME